MIARNYKGFDNFSLVNLTLEAIKMKKLILICLVIAGIFASSFANAQTGFVKGKVEFIRTHNASQDSGWSPPTFWFTLKGVSKAGSCPKWTEGKVVSTTVQM